MREGRTKGREEEEAAERSTITQIKVKNVRKPATLGSHWKYAVSCACALDLRAIRKF